MQRSRGLEVKTQGRDGFSRVFVGYLSGFLGFCRVLWWYLRPLAPWFERDLITIRPTDKVKALAKDRKAQPSIIVLILSLYITWLIVMT